MALSSLGGLSGLGSSIGGEGTASDVHLTVDKRVTFTPTANRSEISYQGSWSELVDQLHNLGVGNSSNGDAPELPDGNSDSNGNYGPARISGAVMTRMPGGLGRLTVTVTQNVHAASFGIDWTEVSKPIKTWRANSATDAPDLSLIRKWEDQKEGNQSAYYGLRVGDDMLTGNTYTLASFILKGIETYSRYAPVFTCSLTVDEAQRAFEVGYRIGTIGAPSCPHGWTDAKGRTPSDFIGGMVSPDSGMEYSWMLVKSVITPNSDGTHQWNLAWQAADEIESALYGTN